MFLKGQFAFHRNGSQESVYSAWLGSPLKCETARLRANRLIRFSNLANDRVAALVAPTRASFLAKPIFAPSRSVVMIELGLYIRKRRVLRKGCASHLKLYSLEVFKSYDHAPSENYQTSLGKKRFVRWHKDGKIGERQKTHKNEQTSRKLLGC